MVFKKSLENTNNKQFLVSKTIFTNMNLFFFFNLCSDLISVIAKKSQSNQEQYSLCCRSHCISTDFHKLKEIRVLGLIFPDYVISYVKLCSYRFI